MPKRKKRRSDAYIRTHPIHPFTLLPIMVIIVLVPLIVRANLTELSESQQIYWPEDVHVDFFSYYKAIWFTTLTYISFAFMLYLYWSKRILLEHIRMFWPIAVYLFFVVVSYLFADPKSIATLGYMGSYQGLFVMVGYGLIVMVVAYMVVGETHMRYLTGAFITVGVLVGIIGVTQYFGRDVFATAFGHWLIFPSSMESLSDSLDIRFGENSIYATMYNTNFVGSFAALMIPFSFALFMRVRHWAYTPLLMGFFALMVFIAFGSNSRAGIVGIGAALLIIIIMFRKSLITHPVKFLIPFVLMGSTGYALNEVSDGRIMDELKSLSIRDDYEQSQERFLFHEVSVHEETIIIDTEESGIRILFKGAQPLGFESLDGETLTHAYENDAYTINEEGYEWFRAKMHETGRLDITAYGKTFPVYIVHEGFRVVNVFGKITVPGSPSYVEWMEPYGSMFNSRVLIWSHSIPLLRDTALIGEGPDMYVTAFPQDDPTVRLNGMGQNSIVDKPHNMYLQIGTNIGLVGLFALLVFFIRYLYESLKLYIRGNFDTFAEFLGVGLMSSIAAYLVTGMFNDQRISVAPLFYAMLGLGVAVNMFVRRKRRERETQ